MTGALHWFVAGALSAMAWQFLIALDFGWAAWCAAGAVICIAGAGLLPKRPA